MSYRLIERDERTARKKHRCIWCGQSIAAGSKYVHERSIFEGDPQSNNWHPECEQAMSIECAGEYDYGFNAYDNVRPNVAAP